MKNILLSVILAALPLSALALTQDDVNFAQRQCQQKNDPAKCRVARDMMRTYQMEQRDKLEHDAAVRSGRPMNGSVNVIIDADPYPGYRVSIDGTTTVANTVITIKMAQYEVAIK